MGRHRPYRHHDLGFAVDLGGAQATANPAGVAVSGPAAKVMTRGYHLAAVPANRARIASDWLLNTMLPRQTVQLGLTTTNSHQPVCNLELSPTTVAGGPAGTDDPKAGSGLGGALTGAPNPTDHRPT